MCTIGESPSRKEPERMSALPELPVDQVSVRQIIADVDRITKGRRRIDIAHALLTIVGQEIASVAETPATAKVHGMLVAKQLKAFVRQACARRQRQGVAT